MLEEYEKIKDSNSSYAPGIYFCGDIAHADTVYQACIEKGIRAIKCTSDVFDETNLSQEEVKEKLEKNELDIVITVAKAREGRDVPTIRVVVNGYPTLSPAKMIQGV
jgi:superfamily II DNA or RNA helicase